MNKLIILALSLLGVLYTSTGIALYFFSQSTFDGLPAYYGDFNPHFVKDAGLAFLSSGLLLFLAIARKEERFAFCCGAAMFVILHGLFHVIMLFDGMVPTQYLVYELLQIILPAAIMASMLVVLRWCDVDMNN